MDRWDFILWVAIPYASIAVFLTGHWFRYKRDQYRWGARSTQLLESRALRYGSNLFHFGALAAIGGHVMGIAVPHSVTDALGVSERTYHVIAGVGGLTAGVAASAGFLILVWRRVRFPRVRVTTTRMDVATFGLLAAAIGTGMWCTISNVFDEVLYRESVAPWFRGLLTLDPDPDHMSGVPFAFGLHVTLVWGLYALWPFSRLVHAWSVPVDYLRRSPIPYRGLEAARSRR
jgi:nitrate reductase gamma subunit